jgi:hypothetical protein
MPYYSLQVTFATELDEEEQLLEYLQEVGISFLEVLCHDKVSDPHFEAMVFGVSVFGRSAAYNSTLVQGRISIQTSCPVPDTAWANCMPADANIRQAQIAETRTGVPVAVDSWIELELAPVPA